MKKKTKRILTGILGTVLVLVIVVLIYLNGIRGEFKEYLNREYPNLSFAVGFTKIDPIYEKFYAGATCLEDGTVFSLSKSFNTKQVSDNYARTKSQRQYNSTLEEVFKGSTIESQIRSITGGGETLFQNNGRYTQINIHLSDDAPHVLAVKEAMHILEGSNITAERIIFTYEMDKSVYEIQLSSDDYDLNEKDIEAKVRRIKPAPSSETDRPGTETGQPETGTVTVRPEGEYFLYPGPEPVFLALPQAMVTGGSIVEVVETQGEWVHLRSGEDQGWLPGWYLEGTDEAPVKDNVLDYLVLKENMQGLLYPDGPVTVDLEKGKLLKPLKERNNWYFAGIIVYDIPAVQSAWVPKDALLPIGEAKPREGFLHKGTEVYETDIFETGNPVEPVILDYTMSVFIGDEKEGYIRVGAAGGWSAWTKKENLKFSYDSDE